MRVTVCKLCDYFFRTEGGKGSLIGMFDAINSREFPFQQPAFHICLEIEFDQTEAESPSVLELALIDEDGKDVIRIRGEMQLPRFPPDRPFRMLQNFKVDGLRFDVPGTYRIDISHNGSFIGEERLYVVRQPS